MKKGVNILFLSFILSLFAACTAVDNELVEEAGNKPSEAIQIVMDVDMPAIQASRAIDEDAIGDYVLFAFENSELICVKKKGDEDIKLRADNKMYVLLPETKNDVQLVLLANVDLSKVKASISDYASMSKNDILAEFDYQCSRQTEAIPMSGETTLQGGVTLGTKGNISLLRSMAKISVAISDNAFEPISMKVVNVNDRATVYSSTTTGVTLPTELGKTNLVQEFGDNNTASVYFGETMNTKEQGERISVLLHGKYKGKETWYRFDMITTQAKELDFLQRNHHYIFAVAGINHLGSDTEQQALSNTVADNEMVESEINLFDITNDAILSITSDNASYVGVSEQVIVMSGDVPVGVTVLTNNPNGWKVDASECEGAFAFSGEAAEANKPQTLWVWKENATSGAYTFYIVAGNIRKAIKVNVN